MRDDLASALIAMAGEDQRVRRSLSEVDAANVARLRLIVAEIGWPTRSKVGETAEHSGWLLLQHADLAFQEECLALMRAAPEGEVCAQHIAYLEDRIAIRTGRPQRYGTQLRVAENGLEPYPIADAAAVDELRRAVGLEPLETYVSRARSRRIG